MISFVFILLLFTPSFCNQRNDTSLVFVNSLWRHGARSSIYSFPSDIHKPSVWPQGLGQLTQVGMRQQFELGSFLKKRYSYLLSSNYNRSEIYIRSTDVDRTLMSAESNMAGMYPPENRQKWNGSGTDWQPIPIHTVPVASDRLLRFPPKNSEEYNLFIERIWNLPKIQKIAADNADFLKEISKFASEEEELTIRNVYHIRDTLVCEKSFNLSMPPWLTPEWMKRLDYLSGLEMGLLFGVGTPYQNEMARLGAGFLVQKILDNMNGVINGSSSYKMIAYSAHDTTIAALLGALDVFDMKSPPFASAIMLELHRKSSSDGSTAYIVRSFYRNSTTERPTQLRILGCPLDCPLEELKKRAAIIYPVNPSPLPNPPQQNYEQELILAFSVTLGLLLFTWLCIFFSKIRMWKKGYRDPSYHRVTDEESDFDDRYKDPNSLIN